MPVYGAMLVKMKCLLWISSHCTEQSFEADASDQHRDALTIRNGKLN